MSVPASSEAVSVTKAADLQLLVFSLAGEECAFRLTDVREITVAGAMTPVPNAPAHVRGVINLRGKVLTVVDLRSVLGLERKAEGRHLIVAEKDKETIGLLVDDVTGVVRAPASSLQSAPEILQAKAHATYLEGVTVLQAKEKTEAAKESPPEAVRLILVLDLPKILSSILLP